MITFVHRRKNISFCDQFCLNLISAQLFIHVFFLVTLGNAQVSKYNSENYVKTPVYIAGSIAKCVIICWFSTTFVLTNFRVLNFNLHFLCVYNNLFPMPVRRIYHRRDYVEYITDAMIRYCEGSLAISPKPVWRTAYCQLSSLAYSLRLYLQAGSIAAERHRHS